MFTKEINASSNQLMQVTKSI